jgi:hypothetical protein
MRLMRPLFAFEKRLICLSRYLCHAAFNPHGNQQPDRNRQQMNKKILPPLYPVVRSMHVQSPLLYRRLCRPTQAGMRQILAYSKTFAVALIPPNRLL